MSNVIKTSPENLAVRIIPKVWITKYALTQGVLTAENAECDPQYGSKMITFEQNGVFGRVNFHKPDWYETEEEARAQVEKMILAARKSLAKKLASLDGYHFTTSPWDQ